MKRTILILGATGMLGNSVYLYLSDNSSDKIFGTSRTKNKKFFKLNSNSLEKDLTKIFKKVKHIDYIVNCIGALIQNDKNTLSLVNSVLPVQLSKIAEIHKTKVIHVSSDGVFSKLAGKVSELDKPIPEDNYGKSKLKGEVNSKNVISLRTSILGLDPIEHKGLLEFALVSKEPIHGYVNQAWSGCTSVQFAKLCGNIIYKNNFEKLRKKSGVFHFAPLSGLTKYKILVSFLKIIKSKKNVSPLKGFPVNRQLVSIYPKELKISLFKKNINSALKELLSFK